MKTQVLAVRLPQDQFDLLQKMADSRGLKISELAKEMLAAGIDGHRTGTNDNTKVLQRLELLETNLLGAQTWLADAVITDLKAAASARFYARLSAENTDEVISYLANNQPLEPKIKAQWQDEYFEMFADAFQNCSNNVLFDQNENTAQQSIYMKDVWTYMNATYWPGGCPRHE